MGNSEHISNWRGQAWRYALRPDKQTVILNGKGKDVIIVRGVFDAATQLGVQVVYKVLRNGQRKSDEKN
ncbi:MAG: hypothetical protein PVJ09_02910 [Candidatus Woesebacteria bacterium]